MYRVEAGAAPGLAMLCLEKFKISFSKSINIQECRTLLSK
jgi:hypothetical protein